MNRIAQEAHSRQAVVKLAKKKGKSYARFCLIVPEHIPDCHGIHNRAAYAP